MKALIGLTLLFYFFPAHAASGLNFTLPGLVNFVINALIIAGVIWLLLFIVEKWARPSHRLTSSSRPSSTP